MVLTPELYQNPLGGAKGGAKTQKAGPHLQSLCLVGLGRVWNMHGPQVPVQMLPVLGVHWEPRTELKTESDCMQRVSETTEEATRPFRHLQDVSSLPPATVRLSESPLQKGGIACKKL